MMSAASRFATKRNLMSCAVIGIGEEAYSPSAVGQRSSAAADAIIPGVAFPSEILAHPLGLAPYTKITGPSGIVPFVPWPAQREVLVSTVGPQRGPGRKLAIVKARQLGITWIASLRLLWQAMSFEGSTALAVSIGQREADDVMGKVVFLFESLPGYIREAFEVVSQNKSTLVLQRRGYASSRIISLPSKAGRGITADFVLADEAAHWDESTERLAALLPASADVGRVLMASTANGRMGMFYATVAGAPDNGWRVLFFAADERPDRDAEWIEVERRAVGEKGAQEFPMSLNEAFLASGSGAFDASDLDWMRSHSARPAPWRGELDSVNGSIRPTMAGEGRWKVWQPPVPGRSYLISADSCGGTASGDFAAAAVYDTQSWDQVGAYHHRTPPRDFARQIARAGWLWNRALLVPESNNHGHAVLALLSEWRYPNVYREESWATVRPVPGLNYGWTTTLKSRSHAIAILQAGVADGSLGIRDLEALGEMEQFVETESGRYEAGPGAHDDRVMTHGIAAAVLEHSNRVRGVVETDRPVRYRGSEHALTGY